jgi:ribosomal protein L3
VTKATRERADDCKRTAFVTASAEIHSLLGQLDNCESVQVKREKTDGFCAVQLGAGEKKLKRVTKPEAGHFQKTGVVPKRKLWEFRLKAPDALVKPGQ